MLPLARWLAPVALATALGASVVFPAPARADDDLVRVVVDVADIVYRSGHPYYRHGDYGRDDRLIVGRDRRGRTVHYRYVPRNDGPPYGNAYGYRRNQDTDYYRRYGYVRDASGRYSRRICDSRGRCEIEYYDPRYDNRDYSHQDRRDRDRYWDGRRWRDRN